MASSRTAADVATNAALLTDRNLEAGRGDDVAVIDPDGVAHTHGDVHVLACRR